MTRKIEKLLIATGNKGKLVEIAELLKPTGIKAIGAFDFNLPEPDETGETFEANAIIKAKYYAEKTGLISLADDSGLCIDALDGQPGIYSARWATNKDFGSAFEKIKQELIKRNIDPNSPNLKAHFICNLSIFDPQTKEINSFEGRVDGTLTLPAIGSKGFGYDPIFTPQGHNITFGQMEPSAKDAISHRAKAFQKLLHLFK